MVSGIEGASEWGGLRVRSGDVVHLDGVLDLATCGVLVTALGVRSGKRDLRLDAAGLSFVDCAGLGTLVELAEAIRARGRRFEITHASPALARVSRLTGQAQVLGIDATQHSSHPKSPSAA